MSGARVGTEADNARKPQEQEHLNILLHHYSVILRDILAVRTATSHTWMHDNIRWAVPRARDHDKYMRCSNDAIDDIGRLSP